jgi:hypothetical protein
MLQCSYNQWHVDGRHSRFHDRPSVFAGNILVVSHWILKASGGKEWGNLQSKGSTQSDSTLLCDNQWTVKYIMWLVQSWIKYFTRAVIQRIYCNTTQFSPLHCFHRNRRNTVGWQSFITDPNSTITGCLQQSSTSLTTSCCHAVSWVLIAIKTTPVSTYCVQWCILPVR